MMRRGPGLSRWVMVMGVIVLIAMVLGTLDLVIWQLADGAVCGGIE